MIKEIKNWLLKKLGCKCDELKLEISTLDDKLLKEKLANDLLIKEIEEKKLPITIPLVLGTIAYKDVIKLLYPITSNIYLSDGSFSVTSVEEAKKFTKKSLIEARKFIAENNDCDNYSYALNGYWSQGLYSFVVGIAWSKNDKGWVHAFNIGIFNVKGKNEVYIIEPQTNTYFKLEDIQNSKTYFPIGLIII